MEYLIRDQLKIPRLGFGTLSLKGEQAIQVIQEALLLGLRHIDTAQIYNNEEEVGKAIKTSSIPRADIFLTTKIWKDFLISAVEIKKSFQQSLCKLQTDYVDLLLIHWPPDSPDSLEDILKVFKELKTNGQTRYIGVSNFNSKLLKQASSICPDILTNQIEYHPLLSQKKMLSLIDEMGIFLTAYSPLIQGKVFKIQQIVKIAEKYNKTASQIALKWLIDQKNIVIVFRASKRKHIEENMNIFDFELEKSDREKISRLNNNQQRIMNPPFSPSWDD